MNLKKVLLAVAVAALTSVGVFAQSATYSSTTPVTTGGGNGGGGGSPVPEPATLALLVASTAGVGLKAWRQKRSHR